MLNFYRLEQYIEAEMEAAHIPGLALAIVKGQEVIYARGLGVTSVEDGGLPVTPQTLFRIGSTTKPLVGTAVMRLVEAGKLDLDRPVKEYLDWFTLSEQRAVGDVTLRRLMTHTAGFPTDYTPYGSRDPEALEASLREELPHLSLLAPPGKIWSYSNIGIRLAGLIAQAVSGKAFTELLQEMVFDPLEMKRTTFDPLVAMTYPCALPHELDHDRLRIVHRFSENAARYPAGGAMSTVLDLAHFAIMQINGGRFHDKQLLSPESVTCMHAPQADLYTVTGKGYGLTFGIDFYKGVRLVGHDGGTSTFGSKFSMAPDAGFAIIMLYNRLTEAFKIDEIAHLIFDQLLDLPPELPKPPIRQPDTTL